MRVDATSADVKEGSRRPFPIWEKDHYDWSTPGHVRWTVEESNYCTPGSYIDVVVKSEAGGGSNVHVAWERSGIGIKGKILIGLVTLTHGETIKKKVFQQAFDRLLRPQSQSR